MVDAAPSLATNDDANIESNVTETYHHMSSWESSEKQPASKLPDKRCRFSFYVLLGTWKATLAVLLERPMLAAASLLVFAILTSAGLAGVLVAARQEEVKARDLAEHGIGAQVAQSLKEALLISTFGSGLLSAVVVQLRSCAALEAQWASITQDIMQRVDPAIVNQLELDMAAVIWKTHPPLHGRLADILYDRDLLYEPSDRPGVVYVLEEARRTGRADTHILGPYMCSEGFTCVFAVAPIFLPAPDELYDWGCGMQPHNCSDLCWDPVSKTKFWGQVSTLINLDQLFSGSDMRLQLLASRGYVYRLWQAETSSSNPYVLLSNNTPHITSPVAREVQIANLLWHLELAPARGWVPPWRDPCLAAVLLAAAAIALLVLWLLVSREQHNRLLRAMLPGNVIRQLQSGSQSIAEHFAGVTVLFSDIVGYTSVASQLSSFEVVTLLNELFSVFDDLTQRNGVYKVETIGDALMCVSGCPAPEPPAAAACRMARMALDMVRAVERFRPSMALAHGTGVSRVQIRVGVHSGPVVAGVVGKRMPRYCLFGDTVNTASRMESTSEPMRVQVSAATAALLRSLPGYEAEFRLEPRGPVAVKGKGLMDTFFLLPAAGDESPAHARHDSLSLILGKPVPGVTVLPPASQQQERQQQQQPQPQQQPQQQQSCPPQQPQQKPSQIGRQQLGGQRPRQPQPPQDQQQEQQQEQELQKFPSSPLLQRPQLRQWDSLRSSRALLAWPEAPASSHDGSGNDRNSGPVLFSSADERGEGDDFKPSAFLSLPQTPSPPTPSPVPPAPPAATTAAARQRANSRARNEGTEAGFGRFSV